MTPGAPAGRARRALRFALPFAVSGGILAFLLARVGVGAVAERVDAGVALRLAAALVVYAVGTLALEALSLARLSATTRTPLGPGLCARLKAASYPLGMIHYGVGVAALAWLLQRRGGLPLAKAAGLVVLVGYLDFGILLVLAASAVLLVASDGPSLRAGGAVTGALVLLVLLVLLRAPGRLGPLERLRQLAFFEAAREAPAHVLVQVAGLRLLFVGLFLGLASAALLVFDVHVPPAHLVVGLTLVAVVAALPIAVSGLGTGQIAFVALFRPFAPAETLLACSLCLSAGILLVRALLGLLFAGELTREAAAAVRGAEA
jgi:hypothetical protein